MNDLAKILSIGVLGTGAVVLGAAALGQSHEFGDFDSNSDDRITLDEWNGGTADAGMFAGHWDGDEWDDAGDRGFWNV
jgi:hypothetical protein